MFGASMYEGWADHEDDAKRQADAGEIEFLARHEVNAVGPMGGITSPTMAVFVVENRPYGNRAHCTINESTGQVMRFGYYGPAFQFGPEGWACVRRVSPPTRTPANSASSLAALTKGVVTAPSAACQRARPVLV
jgi:Protein of unknown function (DUF1116)